MTAVHVQLVDLDLTKTCLDRELIPEGVCLVRITGWLSEYVIRARASTWSRNRGLPQGRCSYAPTEPETQVFFQTVQNKLHFAATGKTAPELIAERADATLPNMGLTTWKAGVVRRGDVTVAKNYLRDDEIGELNRIVVMFLDFAEDQESHSSRIPDHPGTFAGPRHPQPRRHRRLRPGTAAGIRQGQRALPDPTSNRHAIGQRFRR